VRPSSAAAPGRALITLHPWPYLHQSVRSILLT
jgi:hypothetical protein